MANWTIMEFYLWPGNEDKVIRQKLQAEQRKVGSTVAA